MKAAFFISFVIFSGAAHGQIKHNFPMSPSKTDCHKLTEVQLKEVSTDSVRVLITGLSYRFVEHMLVSRYNSPQELSYYSCDAKTGYIIALERDSVYKIYHNVPKDFWEDVLQSRDPINLYNSIAFKKYLMEIVDN